MELVGNFLKDIVIVFFQYITPSVIFAVLAVVAMNYIKRIGWKAMVKECFDEIFRNRITLKRFLFFIYGYFVIDYTLLSREYIYTTPWGEIMEGWWIETNAYGQVSFESIENIIFFIPYIFLLFMAFPNVIEKKSKWKLIKLIFYIAFGTSLAIESCQLITKVGTFQLSDLVYNTLGGYIGYIIYAIVKNIAKRKVVKCKKENNACTII